MESLLILGAGGFGRETAQAVAAINDHRPAFELLGYLDDGPGLASTEVDGVPVLGPMSAVGRYPEAMVVVTTGSPGNYFSRKRIVGRLGLAAERYATLVHPAASVARSVVVGRGSVLLAGVVATASVRIGSHVAVMPGAVLTHDDVVGSYATFGSGARLAGRVVVGEGAYLGSGALVRENRMVGPWALVGMGSVVLRDVPGGEVWAGVPARYLRMANVPEDVDPVAWQVAGMAGEGLP
jgi:sugar O-acyltransferase (sialic acid O-acetyltransferase NeuD family)